MLGPVQNFWGSVGLKGAPMNGKRQTDLVSMDQIIFTPFHGNMVNSTVEFVMEKKSIKSKRRFRGAEDSENFNLKSGGEGGESADREFSETPADSDSGGFTTTTANATNSTNGLNLLQSNSTISTRNDPDLWDLYPRTIRESCSPVSRFVGVSHPFLARKIQNILKILKILNILNFRNLKNFVKF